MIDNRTLQEQYAINGLEALGVDWTELNLEIFDEFVDTYTNYAIAVLEHLRDDKGEHDD